METNISDTPITDAAYFPPSSTMYSLAGEMKKLERQNAQLRAELLACYNRIPGIEQISELPDVILSGTVSDTIHAYGMMQEEKLKRLEEALGKIEAVMKRPASNHRLMQIAGPARQVIAIAKQAKDLHA